MVESVWMVTTVSMVIMLWNVAVQGGYHLLTSIFWCLTSLTLALRSSMTVSSSIKASIFWVFKATLLCFFCSSCFCKADISVELSRLDSRSEAGAVRCICLSGVFSLSSWKEEGREVGGRREEGREVGEEREGKRVVGEGVNQSIVNLHKWRELVKMKKIHSPGQTSTPW